MTRVNFYILSSEEDSSRLQFACRIAEKAVDLGHQVFMLVNDKDDCGLLDQLLWDFKPASFLPHTVAGATDQDETAIVIGSGDCPPGVGDVLINLQSTVWELHQQFTVINEIITADPDSVAAGRESYTRYRSLGYQLETHKL